MYVYIYIYIYIRVVIYIYIYICIAPNLAASFQEFDLAVSTLSATAASTETLNGTTLPDINSNADQFASLKTISLFTLSYPIKELHRNS